MNDPQEVYPFGISKKPGSIYSGKDMPLVTDFSPRVELSQPVGPQAPAQPIAESDPKDESVQEPVDSKEVSSTEVNDSPNPEPPPVVQPVLDPATEETTKPKVSEPSKPTSSPSPKKP